MKEFGTRERALQHAKNSNCGGLLMQCQPPCSDEEARRYDVEAARESRTNVREGRPPRFASV
eukprot:7981575-Lingulodinium_polyedra.AAC.1